MSDNNYEAKPLPFTKELAGISPKTIEIHHDKLYVGYVAKMNEVNAKLVAMRDNGDALGAANQSYSDLRALRLGETFAINGVYLHEYYFSCLGGNPSAELGADGGALIGALVAKWGSLEKFIGMFSASGMAVRGWVVLALDTHANELKIYGCDSHNQGGVWGCLPIMVLDVYEHAYFIDYGSDRKKYIADFWKNMDWAAANSIYEKYSKLIT
jgi:Fe-Mn family superoxide dismutase